MTAARDWRGLLFVAPFVALYSLILIFPLLRGLWLSLNQVDLFGAGHFVGLGNYARLLDDPIFGTSLVNTFVVTLMIVPALPVIALGGTGLVSVASNAIPAEMSHMVGAAISGRWPTARKINGEFFSLMQAHFWEPSPAPVKAVMAMLGRCEEVLRLPMVPVSDATRRKLEALVHPIRAQDDSDVDADGDRNTDGDSDAEATRATNYFAPTPGVA